MNGSGTRIEAGIDSPDAALARPKRPVAPVLVGGLITTVLTLWAIYAINHATDEFNVMGFYVWFVIPLGAIIVGLLCGSGYGVVSWLMGIRIQRGLLLTVCGLQIAAYVTAEYIDYRDVARSLSALTDDAGRPVTPPSFIEYYQFKAETLTFKSRHGNDDGEPLGRLGYLFVALGAIGFVAGGVIAPAVLRSVPYCQGCARYMKRTPLGLIPGSIPGRKFKKREAEAAAEYEAQQDRATQGMTDAIDRLYAAAAAEDADGFIAASQAAMGDAKQTEKLGVRARVLLCHCPECAGGWVQNSIRMGHGKKMQVQALQQQPVSPEFATAVLDALTGAPDRV